MKIELASSHSVVNFAASELQKYLEKMCGAGADLDLRLGLAPDLQLADRLTVRHAWDDEIHVDVKDGRGVIAGANPRSVLLGVYRFLHEAGCRWVRPGVEGEFIPRREVRGLTVSLHERAANRHRAICIEGAVSIENVLELIEWAPKVGFSGYFMQFREGFTFFDRWYSHKNNPLKTPEPFSVEQAREFTSRIEAELQKRGMVYQAIGHGWTCEAYSLPCLGWDMEPGRAWPVEFLQNVAEVNGKRTVPWDIVSIAALCYSDPQVQARLADCVADYAATHPQIDLIHVWLDDGFNNKCECERCRTHRPADDYIVILNAIDECLSRRRLPHKVVFLAYVDMLWPPETNRIHNPDRFVFMFAPFNRDYRAPLVQKGPLPGLPPFERNRLKFPVDVQENLAFLRSWQAGFRGDSFIYDYHFISGLHNYDPGQLHISRVLYDDIRNYRATGFNGLVACQLQRVFFPVGLGMYVMGRTLWDDRLDFGNLADDYFLAAFGADAPRVREYLAELSGLLNWFRLREKDSPLDPAEADVDRRAEDVLRGFLPVIERNLSLPDTCHARSWEYLRNHTEIVRGLARIASFRARSDASAVSREWEALKHFVQENEDCMQSVLDVYAFVDAYQDIFALQN